MRLLEPVDVVANSNHAGVHRLGGFSIRESAATATAATVRLRRATATGQVLAVVELAANESETLVIPEEEHFATGDGVFVEVVAGTVEGVLFDKR